MKRRFFFIITLLAVIVVSFAVWRGRKLITPTPHVKIMASASNTSGVTAANVPVAENQVSPLVLPAEMAAHLAAEQKWARKHNGPVHFYAKVIDQNGAPVMNALMSSTLSIFDEGLFVKDKDRVHDLNLQARSDSAGQLDIKHDSGSWLRIDTLEKDGYVWTHPGFGAFAFGPLNGPKTPPDYANPAKRRTFQMWKKGETKPTLPILKRFRIEEVDSEFAINLLSSERGAENTSKPDFQIKLRYLSPEAPRHQFDRRMTLEVPTGGLIATEDTYVFLAPEGPYEHQFEYIVRPDDLTSGGWKKKFYLKSREGRVYAGLEVRFTLFPHVIEITAIVNPNGSRNLEPDPAKQITDPEEIRRLDEQTRLK